MRTDVALEQLESAIIRRIGRERFHLWFVGHTRFLIEAGELIVGVPNLHFQEWLGKAFGDDVTQAAREVLGGDVALKFRIIPELFQTARSEQNKVAESTGAPPPGPRSDADAPKEPTQPPARTPSLFEAPPESVKRGRSWKTFADFVVGSCNRVAFAAARSIAETPGECANPLVIHGPVGTGKTHLLEAIHAELRRHHPNERVRFATAEDFTNRFIQASRSGKMSQFRKHFRDCDVLLIDDLHFFASKKATQEEFLHTFDSLHHRGSHVVVTCECHPRLTEDLMPELLDRLLGGAVWGLQPPDPKTRIELLRAKSARGSPEVGDEVIEYLARRLRGNVRELEGAIVGIRHFARVNGRAVDVALASEALGELLQHAVRVVGLADIDAAACQVLKLPTGALQSRNRAWAVSHPRMLAIYLARKHTAASFAEIGLYFGGRNHSTAVAAEKKVRQWAAGDETLIVGDRSVRVRDAIELVERALGL